MTEIYKELRELCDDLRSASGLLIGIAVALAAVLAVLLGTKLPSFRIFRRRG